MDSNISELADRFEALLDLKECLVGVRVAWTEQEFSEEDAPVTSAEISYCSAVKLALTGKPVKLPKERCSCGGARRALGFEKPDEDYFSGRSSCDLGLFSDERTASEVARGLKRLDLGSVGAVVMPYGSFSREPMVAIVVTDTYNAMRVVQGYTCAFGAQAGLCMTGNQAICIECTANPVTLDRLNTSFLCSGARFYGKWGPSQVGIGIPAHQLEATCEGIKETLNATESRPRKELIARRLEAIGEDTGFIDYDTTYYLRLADEHRRELAARRQRTKDCGGELHGGRD